MLDVISLGETMVAFTPEEHGYLRFVHRFAKKIAGAESNVAVGVARLGHSSGWMSKLGDDEFGEFVLRELRAEGVDVSRVARCAANPTGIMFKQFAAVGESSVFYYRSNSAASTLAPEDIDESYLAQGRIVHLTGITPALGARCPEAVAHAMRAARAAGALVSFDPNIRLKLWSAETARETLIPLLPLCDIVLLGQDEGKLLLGKSEAREIIAALRDLGVKKIAVKMGDRGAAVADADTVADIPAVPVTSVDNIGAGDAFNAGFLSGVIEGADIRECGEMGALMGACAVTFHGDVEGLPNRRQFDALRGNTAHVCR